MSERADLASISAYGESAEQYTEFARLNRGYIISEQAVKKILAPELKRLVSTGTPPILIADIGSGNGLANMRMRKSLEKEDGISPSAFRVVSIEPDSGQIRTSKEVIKSDIKAHRPITAVPIDVQAVVEQIPLKDNSCPILTMHQAIHWVPKDHLPQALKEIYRVTQPGGLVIFSSSGFLKGFGEDHFTRHPSYLLYLKEMEQELIRKGLWNPAHGEVSPENPYVNPFFHQITMDQLKDLMEKAGFEDVRMEKTIYDISEAEIILRMIKRVSIHLFAGEWAVNINSATRLEIAESAVAKVKVVHSDIPEKLNDQPAFDAVVLYWARKPA